MGLTKVYDKCSINARSKKDPRRAISLGNSDECDLNPPASSR